VRLAGRAEHDLAQRLESHLSSRDELRRIVSIDRPDRGLSHALEAARPRAKGRTFRSLGKLAHEWRHLEGVYRRRLPRRRVLVRMRPARLDAARIELRQPRREREVPLRELNAALVQLADRRLEAASRDRRSLARIL
jgi:hypothetical protein